MQVIWTKIIFIALLSFLPRHHGRASTYQNTLCPTGFQHWSSSCYHIESTTRKSRDNARLMCESLGSRLVEITSVDEDEFVRSLALARNMTVNYWIGADGKHKDYHWMDGTPLNFTFWDNHDGGSHNANSDCVRMKAQAEHRWNDKRCDHLHQVFCEGNISDQVCDGHNVTLNSSCYFVGDIRYSRDGARQFCKGNGAHLVYVETAEENTFLLSQASLITSDGSYWIGLTRHPLGRNQTEFIWMSGESMVYSNIGTLIIGSACLQIKHDNNYTTWDDQVCAQSHGYICERKELSRHQRGQVFRMKQGNSLVPIPEAIINDFRTSSIVRCASLCTSIQGCLSFAYSEMERICILANSTAGTTSQEDGFRHYVTV